MLTRREKDTTMHDIDKRLAALRREIELLKAARRVTFDPTRQQQIYARLSECIVESIQLIEERIEKYVPHLARRAQPAPNTPREPAERPPLAARRSSM
jgi:hypothetical protein